MTWFDANLIFPEEGQPHLVFDGVRVYMEGDYYGYFDAKNKEWFCVTDGKVQILDIIKWMPYTEPDRGKKLPAKEAKLLFYKILKDLNLSESIEDVSTLADHFLASEHEEFVLEEYGLRKQIERLNI
jgi:hypothetical protein